MRTLRISIKNDYFRSCIIVRYILSWMGGSFFRSSFFRNVQRWRGSSSRGSCLIISKVTDGKNILAFLLEKVLTNHEIVVTILTRFERRNIAAFLIEGDLTKMSAILLICTMKLCSCELLKNSVIQ